MRRRAFTVIEVLLSAFISALLIGGIAGLMSSLNAMAGRSLADYAAKEILFRATGKMAPSIRSAMIVNPSSDATHLILEEPLVNADGSLALPLQAGDETEFYLSDSTGSLSAAGTILWKAVNGVPDRKWAYMGSAPNVDISPGSLQFTYSPNAADPTQVQIDVSTTKTTPQTAINCSIYSVVSLRNHSHS